MFKMKPVARLVFVYFGHTKTMESVLKSFIVKVNWKKQVMKCTKKKLSLVNCWPSENGQGGCDVNIEYELEHTHLELNDVSIHIPLPMGCAPVIAECDGDYAHDARKNALTWSLALIDLSNRTGALEFSVASATPSDFFPLSVSFVSKMPYADLRATEVLMVDDDEPVKFSSETVLYTEKYEIV